MTVAALRLRPVALTRDRFVPFGDVIETEGHAPIAINDGFAEQYGDLANIDVAAEEGRVRVNIYRASPHTLPMPIRMVERHPLSSQMFVGLSARPFLVVVARPGGDPSPRDLHAFVTNGRQGVNYAPGTWHHPLIAYGSPGEFLVVDRGGTGDNLDEVFFGDAEIVLEAPLP